MLMQCGHESNSTYNNKPYCLICDCKTLAGDKFDLTNRRAKCVYCNQITDSNYNLPMFQYCKNQQYDTYYCGCRGWD